MERLANCLVCGSKKIINKKSLIDYSLTKEIFSLYQCLSCGGVFTNPRPKKNKINKYYDLKKYDSYNKKVMFLVLFIVLFKNLTTLIKQVY